MAVCGGSATTTPTPGGETTTTTLSPANGCDAAAVTDLRGQSGVTVQFGVAGLSYDPACFTVSPGAPVTFSGAFAAHPLVGGRVAGGARMPDPSSPFGGPTSSGTSKTFTLAEPGTFPFYCDFHALVGIKGRGLRRTVSLAAPGLRNAAF